MFIGSVASLLRGREFSAEYVYIHEIKTKCMPLLFYGVDCLRVDAYAMEKLSRPIIWNTAFRWVLSFRRFEHMHNKLRQCGTISFKFLINMKFLLFVHNLKCCNTTSLLLYLLANCYDSSSEVMK